MWAKTIGAQHGEKFSKINIRYLFIMLIAILWSTNGFLIKIIDAIKVKKVMQMQQFI
jgi:hypothetical protein